MKAGIIPIMFCSLALAAMAASCNLEKPSDKRTQFIGRWDSYSTYDSLDVLDQKVNETSFLGQSYKFDGIWEYFYYEKNLQRNAGFFTYDDAKKTIYLSSTFNRDDTLTVVSVDKNKLILDKRAKTGKYYEYHKSSIK